MTVQRNGSSPESYDDWYRSGQAHWQDAPGKSVLVAAIERSCDPGRALSLLDVGCGTGSFLDVLSRRVSSRWEYHGVDISDAAIEIGRQQYPDLRLTAADASSLPAPDASFDVVTCYGSWEHFAEPKDAIAEAARVLVPGGWFFAMIPTLGIHRTDRDDEGWYEDTEVAGCDIRQQQWNLRRETWAEMFDQADLLLFEDTLAAACGARKPGVFFFGVRTAMASDVPSPVRRALLELEDLARHLSATLELDILRAVELMAASLKQGGKILVCGNGGSAADAQHFVAELVGRLRADRPALPAVSLCTDPSVVTSVANDYGYEQIFSRQVEALGSGADTLVAISTSGRSGNVLAALSSARELGLRTVALVGPDTGPELERCDLRLSIPARNTQRIQEAHTAVLHAIGEALEARLIGGDLPLVLSSGDARAGGETSPAVRRGRPRPDTGTARILTTETDATETGAGTYGDKEHCL